ncbi:MAG: hypothetical protein FJ096_10425 [Deltaproteobacteria bacterium]|nr:hypothetical protein [Deltaproteobacteria bacterium]
MMNAQTMVRAGALLVLVACNAVTGAEGVEFVDGVGGNDSASATGSTVSSTSATSGPGQTAASTGAAMASSGAGSSSSSVVASSSTGASCVYPAGPYGVSLGKIIPKNLKWQGYLAGGQAQGTLTTEELFDCDGTKGINAILFDTSQFG